MLGAPTRHTWGEGVCCTYWVSTDLAHSASKGTLRFHPSRRRVQDPIPLMRGTPPAEPPTASGPWAVLRARCRTPKHGCPILVGSGPGLGPIRQLTTDTVFGRHMTPFATVRPAEGGPEAIGTPRLRAESATCPPTRQPTNSEISRQTSSFNGVDLLCPSRRSYCGTAPAPCPRSRAKGLVSHPRHRGEPRPST